MATFFGLLLNSAIFDFFEVLEDLLRIPLFLSSPSKPHVDYDADDNDNGYVEEEAEVAEN